MAESKYPLYKFMLLNFFTWSSVPLLYAMLPVHFKNIGFDDIQIGLLTALGPLCCIIVQPFIGVMADRARFKNTVLQIIYIGITISILFMAFRANFYYLLIIGLFLAIFQSGMISLNETVTLEYLESTKWSYGIVRVWGSVGYALLAILAGALMKSLSYTLFIITAASALMSTLLMMSMPRIKGHQSGGNQVSFLKLFKNPKLIVFIFFHMIIQITLSFFASFFPVFLSDIGGSERLFGFILFIQTITEVPFLFFGDRIIGRFGVSKMLMGSMLIMSVRMLLLSLVHNPIWTVPINFMHIGTYIVFTYCLSTFINHEVPKELKATGQAFNNVIGMGVGRMIGSILGGFLSQTYGSRQTFFLAFVLDFAAFIVFGCILYRMNKKSEKAAVIEL